MTDEFTGGTNRVVPVSALETYIQDKKGYADFIQSTAAPDGVATEVRDFAVELERLVEERSVELETERSGGEP
jgi:predicted nucleic-acid-binding protein